MTTGGFIGAVFLLLSLFIAVGEWVRRGSRSGTEASPAPAAPDTKPRAR
jgi:hypothetical protein